MSMHEVESFEHANRRIVIYLDPEPMDPREWDNLCHIACWHRRADLGDETISPMTAKEIIKRARDAGDRVLAILPMWLYKHSGMTVRASKPRPGYPFTCQWDSGQVGWAYVLRSQAEKMGCVGTYTDHETKEVKTYDKAYFEDVILQEVSTYDDFLTGQCYGYVVYGQEDDNLDSCWGFYIDSSDYNGPGGIEYVRSEARAAAEATTDPAIEAYVAEIESRATYAGPVS